MHLLHFWGQSMSTSMKDTSTTQTSLLVARL